MAREDISDHLIHFTKASNGNRAFDNFRSILNQQRIIGSHTLIKGGYNCVCFSEAPLSVLTMGLLNPNDYSKYSPFGFMFEKKWIFDNGGRPVIYQPENEYESLTELHRWRHMRYEPTAEAPTDFSWEREWRVQTDGLDFDSSNVVLILPSQEWADAIIAEHEQEEEFRARQYDALDLYFLPKPFEWEIRLLRPT